MQTVWIIVYNNPINVGMHVNVKFVGKYVTCMSFQNKLKVHETSILSLQVDQKNVYMPP